MSMSTASEETTFGRLRDALDEKGEVMVETASGETYELHKHNVEFEDEPYVKVEADGALHWIDTTFVERYWIHEEL